MSYSDITANAGFRLIDYASDPWSDDDWFNWKLLDGLLTLNQPAIPFVVATGTGAAYVADYTPDQTLAVGLSISFKVPLANTGAVTLAVDGQAAKPIKINGSDPSAGALPLGMYVRVVYDGTNFNVVYPSFTSLSSNKITVGISGATADPLANSFIVENSTSIGFSLLSPNGSTGRIYFGSVAKPDGGGLVYDHGANRLYLRANQYNGPYVDADKVIRQPDRPFVYAQKSYSTTASEASAATIIFNTELFDLTNSYDNTTGIFTAPIAGVYEILMDVEVLGSAAVNHVHSFNKNGATELATYTTSVTTTSVVYAQNHRFFVTLAATDTLQIKMKTNGGASNLSGYAAVTIRLVS